VRGPEGSYNCNTETERGTSFGHGVEDVVLEARVAPDAARVDDAPSAGALLQVGQAELGEHDGARHVDCGDRGPVLGRPSDEVGLGQIHA